jgi:tripartite-type tricarboxylate transporter receptor subunit TctC
VCCVLQIGQWGTNVASGAVHNLPIDLLKDLEPVALLCTQPFMIVGKKALPANNLKAPG